MANQQKSRRSDPTDTAKAYRSVFAGAGKKGTHATRVLNDLHEHLVREPRPTDSYQCAIAMGSQMAYFYILDMIESAQESEQNG